MRCFDNFVEILCRFKNLLSYNYDAVKEGREEGREEGRRGVREKKTVVNEMART